jgi:hypothetical protein
VNASRRPSRDAAHHSGSGRMASPYPMGDFHLLFFASFPGALRFGVKMRKTQHEQMFSAIPPIADILAGERVGFVEVQQGRVHHSITAHYANSGGQNIGLGPCLERTLT